MKRVVVVAPTYNERENIAEFIDAVFAQEKRIPGWELHLLISDSHSPDGTGEIVKERAKINSRLHYLDVLKRGIGIGLIEGVRYAINKLGATHLISMDADVQHDPNDISRFLTELEKGHELVIGSRLMPNGKNELPIYRQFFTIGASTVCRLFMNLWSIREFTTSFRAFTKELFLRIPLDRVHWRSRSYVVQPSFLYRAIQTNPKWIEIPIVFRARSRGRSKNQVIRYIVELTLYVIQVRLESLPMFMKFLIVGTVSWAANAGSLKLFYTIILRPLMQQPGQIIGVVKDSGLFWSSAISIEISILVNFFFNENWTFRERDRNEPVWQRLAKFHLTTIGSPIIQFATINTLTPIFGIHYQASLAIGIIIGLLWNWTWNVNFVWKAKKANLASKTS
ncbi:MAG: glycosyltransferase [bacterium]|nr:glycosyltransferase [bacterium]